jgi:hypothetical protein
MMSILERRKAKASNLLLTAPIAALAVSGFTAAKSNASAIGASDLLVYQSGTSTVADGAGGSTLTIDDFNTTSNTISQTWNVTNLTGNSSSSTGTTLYSNSNGSNGQLALSANGTEVSFGGYQGLNSNELAQTTRQAAYLTADGTFTTAATYTETTGGQVRSAYTPDGTNPNYLFSDKSGIYGPTSQLNTTNVRYVAGFGGIDYALAQGNSTTPSFYTFNTTSNTVTAVAGISNNAFGSGTDFDLLQSGTTPGVYDTLYVANGTNILKYGVSYTLGVPSLTAEGSDTISAVAGTTGKIADLVGVEVGSNAVDIYFTTTSNASDPGSIEEVVDNQATGTMNASATPGLLYSAPTGVDLFGIETAPVAVPEPASIGLLACGLGLMARRSRRRQAKA